jgi:hypothetical protein
MKKLGLFIVLAASALFMAPTGGILDASAQETVKKGKALRGVVRPYRRGGGYSYKYLQGTNTRKFVDPSLTAQTDGGPFDNGFFFSSPNAPHGGDSPYMQ